MAVTGGSSVSATRYDVFLSFRGPDTRKTFIDCLYRTMLGQGIVAYIDSEELHAGDRIDDLLKAVGDSKICIPVLSRSYASSPWCLRELAHAMELNESTKKPEILPIFFDVTSSDVKLKTKLYVEDLDKHEQRPGGESREQWEAALRKVGKIMGWEVHGKGYGEVIELVVNKVLHKLNVKQRPLDNKLVGVDEQVEATMELLDADSSTGVRFVGIYGMSGIGKTTLANIVFNKLCPRFDGQCSFIENIRESSKGNGLVDLQKQLASDISDSRFIEKHTGTWMDSIRRRAGSKKVLIVLDDLDNKEQLKKLVGGPETFGSGSIIIITTRNKQILDGEKGILTYEVKQIDHDKALELFSLHAFNSVSPPGVRRNLSQEIVYMTGGLPLALEVIGSSLRGQDEEIWKDMLKRLKNVPHDGVLDKLEICYDALRDQEKEIFLDIACFFIDEKKSRATYFWDACNLYPHISLKKLADLCLIKIVRGDVIWMHDQLRDLGRHTICRESIQILIGRSRLWNYEEALQVVQSRERKDKLQALNLVEHRADPIRIANEELERMPHVKFLKLRAGTFVGDIKNYLQELRWFSWDSPPLDCRMANLHFENLVVFELSNNGNTENWGGWNILKMPNKLKVLSLSGCSGLKRTPDFSGCLSLERLSLEYCQNLQEVDPSIGKLKGLNYLDIHWCTSLQTLPEEIGGLVNLKHFSIGDCTQVKKLPYSIGKLTSLSKLDLSSSIITSLPDSIGNAKHLSSLDLSYTPIEELPNSIGELTQLEFLSLHKCRRFRELPESIGNLTSLQELDLSRTNIVELPDSIINLKQLKVMTMNWSPIRRLPASIGMLERLEELSAIWCKQLGELPTEIGSLSSLQKLDLTYCNELQGLPKLPSSLNCLLVRSTSLRLVSDLSNLTNLVELLLCNLSEGVPAQTSNPMQSLQLQWVGKLSKLKELSWGLSDIPVPLTELGCLPQLRELTVSCIDCFNSIVVGPQLSNLKSLSILWLYRCPQREIQLDGLELLRDLTVMDCKFLERLSVISSSFRKLREMRVSKCPKLLEIRFLSMMESLENLEVSFCHSLEALCGLLNLKKLKGLRIEGCGELQVIEGFEELELLDDLFILDCRSLKIWTNVLNSKIPKHCNIEVSDSGMLPNNDDSVYTFEQLEQMILDRTRKTSNKLEGEEAQRKAKRQLERERGRKEAIADMSEDLSDGEEGDAVDDISAHGDSNRGELPRISSVDAMEIWISQQKGKKLYIVLISLHGLIRGENMELGRDSDTGGQVKYVVELARALGSMPGVYRVDLLTRHVSSPDVDWSYGEPMEMLTPRNSEGLSDEMGESSGAYIVRIPFGPRDKYIPRELIWPYIPEFVDGALNHVIQMSKVLGEQVGGGQPVWPVAIHGHYADAGDSAALLSGALNVPMLFTGDSLGRDKLEQLLKQGRLSKDEINTTYKIMRRIEAEELSLDASEIVITSTRQEIDEQWRLYDGFDPILERKLRARMKRNVSCYGRFMPRMAIIPPGMFHNIAPQDGDMDGEAEGNDDHPTTPDPPIWPEIMRFFNNPWKPMILALARLDPKENITTLVKAFGECRPLRELANLTLIMSNRDGIDEMSSTNASVLLYVLKLIDKYNLYGQVAYPKHHKQSDVPDIYRLAAKTKGVFINPAFIEPFGLTLIEAAAHGLPIVATKNGDSVDIHRVLIDPHDQQSIADALLKLVADKQLWARCRQNGLKNIHLFSWPEHCKTYLSRIVSRIASSKPRHPQWQISEDGLGNSESDSPSDSLRDIQDLSLNLKFSLDGEKNEANGNENSVGSEENAADRKSKLENAVMTWSKGVLKDRKTGLVEKSDQNANSSKFPPLRRRKHIFVLAVDCDSLTDLLEITQKVFSSVEKERNEGSVGFILSTSLTMSEIQSFLVSGGLSPNDFDAFICNSGSDLYYPSLNSENSPFVIDFYYHSHIDYRWGGEGLRKTLVRWAASITDKKVENEAQIVTLAEKLSTDYCYTFKVEKPETVPPVKELRRKMRIQALRSHAIYCQNWTRLNVIPVLASRAQALRYLYVRWGVDLSNMVVFVGECGDTDYEGLLGGLHKSVILKGVCGSASNRFHANRNYPLADVMPFDSPNIVQTSQDCSSDDIRASLENLGVIKE